MPETNDPVGVDQKPGQKPKQRISMGLFLTILTAVIIIEAIVVYAVARIVNASDTGTGNAAREYVKPVVLGPFQYKILQSGNEVLKYVKVSIYVNPHYSLVKREDIPARINDESAALEDIVRTVLGKVPREDLVNWDERVKQDVGQKVTTRLNEFLRNRFGDDKAGTQPIESTIVGMSDG